MSLRKEHEILKVERDSLSGKVLSQENEIDDLRDSILSLTKQLSDKELEYKHKDNAVKDLEDSKENFRERLVRKSEECDRLRDDIKSQAEQLMQQQSRIHDTMSALTDVQGRQLPLEFEKIKLTRENDLLKDRLKSVEVELEEKNQEYVRSRKDLTDKVFNLESTVSLFASENGSSKDLIKVLQDKLADQDEKFNEYMTQIRDLEISKAADHDNCIQEINAQKRLLDLHKKYFEDASTRVTELESEAKLIQEAHVKQLNQAKSSYQTQLNSLTETMEQNRITYDEKLKDLEKKLEETRAVVPLGSTLSEDLTAAATSSTSGGDLFWEQSTSGIMSTTETYTRIMNLERALNEEQSKRKEVEMYLSRILKDIEAKTPLITAQRRDYQRVLDSHERLTKRLDEVALENSGLREQARSAEQRMNTAVKDKHAIEVQNKDLSTQLQHLLKKNLERSIGSSGLPSTRPTSTTTTSTSSSSVISEYLLTFDDIMELQTRNIQLLKVVRKLSEDQERTELSNHSETIAEEDTNITSTSGSSQSLTVTTSSGVGGNQFQLALRELQSMREARQRTEDMVVELVQQRDMYKAMLEQAETSLSIQSPDTDAATSAVGSVSETSAAVAVCTSSSSSLSVKLQDLQWKMTQLEEEKNRLKIRLSRSEEAEKAMNDALDKTKSETSQLSFKLAQMTAEANFQTSRNQQLESALNTQQQTLENVFKRRAELEGLLIVEQKNAKTITEHMMQVTEAHKVTQEALRRAEVARDVSIAAEERLIQQLAEAREETRRQSALSDSLMRIEHGLSSRAEETASTAAKERDSLQGALDRTRQEMENRTLLSDQRILSLEEDLRQLRQVHQQVSSEVTDLRSRIETERSTAKASQERSSVLEAQLVHLQGLLEQVHGTRTVEAVATADTAQLELALERSAAELDSLRTQLNESQKHTEQFRRIGAATESILNNLREKTNAAKEALEAEILKLRGDLETVSKDLTDTRQASMIALQEAEEARAQLIVTQRQVIEKDTEIHQLKESIQISSEQVQGHTSRLQQDVEKYHQAARVANANYERELQMHAEATSRVQGLETEIDKLKLELESLQQQVINQSTDMIQRERVYEEERKHVVIEKEEMKSRLEELQRTNDLLHSQVQALGLQVDRIHQSRMDAAAILVVPATEGSGSSGVDGTAITTTTPTPTEIETTVISTAELADLRKSSIELREVLRFMKREKDTLEARLSLAETEVLRHQATVSATQRSLSEARAELKREVDSRVGSKDANEFNKLLAEITQLNVVRESNAHLRSENEELSRRVTLLTESLKKEVEDGIPLQEKIRELEGIKAGLIAEKDSFARDATYWKDRLHQLVSRYNDVDPEEHRILRANLENTQKSVSDLQVQIEVLKKEKSDVIVSLQKEKLEISNKLSKELEVKNAELKSLTSIINEKEKNADMLRNHLRTGKTKIQELEKKSSDLLKSLNESKQQIVEVKREAQEANSKINQLESQVSLLTAAAATAAATAATLAPTPVVTVAATAPVASSTLPSSSSSSTTTTTTSELVVAEKTGPFSSLEGDAKTPPAPAHTASPAQGFTTDEESLRKILMSNLTRVKRPAPPASTAAAVPSVDEGNAAATPADSTLEAGEVPAVKRSRPSAPPPPESPAVAAPTAPTIVQTTHVPEDTNSGTKMEVEPPISSVDSTAVGSTEQVVPPAETSGDAVESAAAVPVPKALRATAAVYTPPVAVVAPASSAVPAASGRLAVLSKLKRPQPPATTATTPAATTTTIPLFSNVTSSAVATTGPVFAKPFVAPLPLGPPPASTATGETVSHPLTAASSAPTPFGSFHTAGTGFTSNSTSAGGGLFDLSKPVSTGFGASVSSFGNRTQPPVSVPVPVVPPAAVETLADTELMSGNAEIGRLDGESIESVVEEEVTSSYVAFQDIPARPPASTSPFLPLSVPSPSAAGTVKLFFGSKPNNNLPVPSNITPTNSTSSVTSGGSNLAPLKSTGESLFGVKSGFLAQQPQQQQTGTAPFGTFASPFQTSVSTTGTSGQDPGGVGSIFRRTSSAGSSSGTLGQTPSSATVTVASASAEKSSLVEAAVAVVEDSHSQFSAGEGTIEGGDAGAPGGEAPIISLKPAVALTAEEKRNKRSAKFGGVVAANASVPAVGAKRRLVQTKLGSSSATDGSEQVANKPKRSDTVTDDEVSADTMEPGVIEGTSGGAGAEEDDELQQ